MNRVFAGFLVLVLVGCNEVPTIYSPANGAAESGTALPVPGGPVDLLWVIDNSGSMCQEQAALADSFEQFASELAASDLDFHIAVTTTQVDAPSNFDAVARSGEIQSTPRPVPGWDPSCHLARDEQGQLVPGDWAPVRDALRRALACAPDVDPADYDWTDEQIACVFDLGSATACSLPGRSCTDCGPEDLFPAESDYLELPAVLRAEDYLLDGELDVARLTRDFGCMALVGTRGYGFERGLDAAVLAVSPEKTGGSWGQDNAVTTAPNHGFIREVADFGVVFVTDENDCSHDGTLEERTSCGSAQCAYAGLDPDGPLVDPLAMSAALKANLAATKGRAIAENEVFAASIHGRSVTFEGPALDDVQCRGKTERELLAPTCSSDLGDAGSGDRYETFLSGFERAFPQPDQHGKRTPWICASSFASALEGIGRTARRSGCVQRELPSCVADTECAADRNGNPGQCVEMSGLTYRVCNTDIDVVAVGTFVEGGCVAVSGDRCVVDPALYTFEACAATVEGFAVRWANPRQAGELFSDATVELRLRIE